MVIDADAVGAIIEMEPGYFVRTPRQSRTSIRWSSAGMNEK